LANRDILLTKLSEGKTRSDLVRRPRLALDFGSRAFNTLTFVCAQAGYGKTTLIASWTQTKSERFAWLSLDRADNDAPRFLAHILAAIRTQVPQFATDMLRILQTPNPPPIYSLMTGLVNALANVQQRLILVMDDYHVVSETEVHQAVLFLLENQPGNLHIIIASREEPPFSLARLHSHGRMRRITEHDLCFTQQEAENFFNRLMQLELSTQQSEILRLHTEGWAAGLQMAALSLANGKSKADFIASFSGKERHIVDFLVDEVLSNQSVAVQSFLIRTSILERFNAELCQVLSGDLDSQAVLLHLERNHLFLVPLDANREWYRYHHLFSELLQSRLNKLHPEQVPALHNAAARWHAEQHLPADALRHAQCAQNTELIAQILDQHAISMFALGQVRTVATWLKLLPETVILQYPRLALLAAFNLYFHSIPDVALAERYLAAIDLALANAENPQQDAQDLRGKVAVVRGYQARFAGQAMLALNSFTLASDRLTKSDVFYDIAMINLAILHATQGRLAEAAAIWSSYAELNEGRPYLWITTTGIFGLSRIQMMRGKLRQAKDICLDGLRQFRVRDLQDMPVCSMLHLQLGEIAYLQNQLEEADIQASRALELAKAGGMELNQACSEVLLVRVKLARGEPATLNFQYEQRLLEFWASVSLILPPISGYLAQLWWRQDRIKELSEWFVRRGINSKSIKPAWEMECLVLAHLLLQQRRNSEAFDLLNQLQLNAEQDQRMGALIEITILLALVRVADDKQKSATAFVCQALALAKESEQLQPFLNAGSALYLLLKKMDVPAELLDFSSTILKAFEHNSGHRHAGEKRISILSGKEEKVARLVVAGLSNDEIAEKLFVSPNTVKYHIKSLYRKLDVTKRFDAIQKIRNGYR
jgi:LuxR family maltose regulon positive regulatory protein